MKRFSAVSAIATIHNDNTSSTHPHIISRETPRHSINLSIPPIINTLSLLHNANAIALPESQIAICLTFEIIQSRNKLGLLRAPEAFGRDRGRRFLFLGCDAGCTDRRCGRSEARFFLRGGEVVAAAAAAEVVGWGSVVGGRGGAAVGLAGVGVVGEHRGGFLGVGWWSGGGLR